MKAKLFLLAILSLVSIFAIGQTDITKFLGIPIDGSKQEMIQKIEAKGFKWNVLKECLEGEFNGRDVYISVVTNNNKVYRIFIIDKYGTSESNIKNRFNTLCNQFKNNKKYYNSTIEQEIPEEEDISIGMNVDNKTYEASFLQLPEFIFNVDLENITETDLSKYPILKDFYDNIIEVKQYDNEEMVRSAIKLETSRLFLKIFEEMSNKCVWFKIIKESYDNYKIAIYYDNKYNEAHGEDL